MPLCSFGKCPEEIYAVAFRMKATMQPTMGPSNKELAQKPFKYTEKRMVANKVVRI